VALFAMLCHEVLAEIFLCYAETAELLSPTPKLPPPLLLDQICSIWRYVVHDTPVDRVRFVVFQGVYHGVTVIFWRRYKCSSRQITIPNIN